MSVPCASPGSGRWGRRNWLVHFCLLGATHKNFFPHKVLQDSQLGVTLLIQLLTPGHTTAAKVISCQSLPPWQDWIGKWDPVWMIRLCPGCDWKLLGSRELVQGSLKKHPYNCCQYYYHKSKAQLCKVLWERSWSGILKMQVDLSKDKKTTSGRKWLKKRTMDLGGGWSALQNN